MRMILSLESKEALTFFVDIIINAKMFIPRLLTCIRHFVIS